MANDFVFMELSSKGIEAIRKRPHVYVKNGVFNPELSCERLCNQGLALGATNVLSSKKAGWWLVSSDYDWLSESDVFDDPTYPFFNLVSDPKLGVNSFYFELVIASFSAKVMLYSKGKVLLKLGDIDGEEVCLNSVTEGSELVIAFKK